MLSVDIPIYALCPGLDEDSILAGGGGGSESKTGVRNGLCVLAIRDGKLTQDKFIETDTLSRELRPSGVIPLTLPCPLGDLWSSGIPSSKR
jgi:hypothetical protein